MRAWRVIPALYLLTFGVAGIAHAQAQDTKRLQTQVYGGIGGAFAMGKVGLENLNVYNHSRVGFNTTNTAQLGVQTSYNRLLTGARLSAFRLAQPRHYGELGFTLYGQEVSLFAGYQLVDRPFFTLSFGSHVGFTQYQMRGVRLIHLRERLSSPGQAWASIFISDAYQDRALHLTLTPTLRATARLTQRLHYYVEWQFTYQPHAGLTPARYEARISNVDAEVARQFIDDFHARGRLKREDYTTLLPVVRDMRLQFMLGLSYTLGRWPIKPSTPATPTPSAEGVGDGSSQ